MRLFIEDERIGQRADLQQPVPVGGVSRQARNFQTEHNARFAQTHFRDQFLKAFPIDSRCTGLPQVAVDDDDALHRPAQGNRLLAQSVLTLGAFGIFEHLAKRGLADVKVGVSLQVPGVHFLVCDACHGVASCCRERIMLASSVVSCERISTGMVSWPSESEQGAVSTAVHSEHACIQAVMPRRRKSASPKLPPPVRRVASRRSCS